VDAAVGFNVGDTANSCWLPPSHQAQQVSRPSCDQSSADTVWIGVELAPMSVPYSRS